MRAAWLSTIALMGCGLTPTVDLGLPLSGTDTALTGLPAGRCAARPVEGCEVDDRCVLLVARPLLRGPRGYCHDHTVPVERVGCRSANADCGFAQSFARDRDGEVWWLPDQCLPDDWDGISDTNPPDC